MAVTVREAAPGEFAEVGALTVEAYLADGQLKEETGNYAEELVDVATRARNGQVLIAVDDQSDEVLGAVTLCLRGSAYAQLAKAGEAEFRMLAVAPSAQGRGVGEALVRACLKGAVDAGYEAVVICTRSFALPAQRLYQRLGFERVPERDWSPAPRVDLLALRIALTEPASTP